MEDPEEINSNLSHTLLIKNLPKALSDDATKALLIHYGSIDVRIMKEYGKLKGHVFADFSNKHRMEAAQRRLNNLVLADYRVEAHVAKPISNPSNQSTKQESGLSNIETTRNLLENISTKHSKSKYPTPSSISAELGIDYPFPPQLEYKYPKATIEIIQNIGNAMLAVPNFYIQVLHLMNKMNLPTPFTPSSIPGPMNQVPKDLIKKGKKRTVDSKNFESSSEDEAEVIETFQSDSAKSELDIILDNHSQKARKKKQTTHPMQIHLQGQDTPQISSTLPYRKRIAINPFDQDSSKALDERVHARPGVISQHELEDKKICDEELLKSYSNLIKNYFRGGRSCSLYIKNLSRNVETSDLLYVYGCLFSSEEEAKRSLKIQIFTEGRMKGQAFVTFPTEDLAEKALECSHGLLLEGKPMIVAFKRKKNSDLKT